MITFGSLFESSWPKIFQILSVIVIFFGFYGLAFAAGARIKGKKQNSLAIALFLVPALILVMTGLGIPAIQTFIESFKNADSSQWVGFKNYSNAIKDPDIRLAFINTISWVIICPVIVTTLGITLATMLNKMKREAFAKSLIFMPMAISFVGASIIFKFMYEYRDPGEPQIGLLSAIAQAIGFGPSNWLLVKPLNTLLLMVVFIWTQTGFAMVILSAAIKGVPADVMEASALDGATGWKLFKGVTFPIVRTTFIVVLATMVVASLKLFDIVRTMTGGNFGTSVLANEMYSQIFVQFDAGKGSALAVMLFASVIPIFIYNIRTLKSERANS
jgi:alpha-glucoside transport system permease protein